MMMTPGDSERLRSFLSSILGGQAEYEPLASLSDEQIREWNEIERISNEASLLQKEAAARTELFWVKVRRALGPEGDRESLKVENHMVLGTKRGKLDPPNELTSLSDGDTSDPDE